MGARGGGRPPVGVIVRAEAAAVDASGEVRALWRQVSAIAVADVPPMGLSAGERPAADVEVLCSAVAGVEFELARRMAAASGSGSLPLVGDGAMLLARGVVGDVGAPAGPRRGLRGRPSGPGWGVGLGCDH